MTSHRTEQLQASSDPMGLQIHPEDADTAFTAGVQFARALVGSERATFMLALSEQVALIRNAVLEAGYSRQKAYLAAEAFGAGACNEWLRIASPEQPVIWGNA